MNTLKAQLQNKLFDALSELKRKSAGSNSTEVQRMFGVVLGIRIALMELNRLDGNDAYAFSGSLGIQQLLRDEFGAKTRAEIRAYEFPEF